MSIKGWHRGKLILLWVWGLVLTAFFLNNLRSEEQIVSGFILIVFILGIPIVLSILTWKWLSGQEGKQK